MVMDVVYNIALLLALGVVYAILPYREVGKSTRDQVLSGLVIGLAGLLIMAKPFTYYSGIVYDSRSILLSVAGMFFGFVPTTIGALILTANRILMGGPGIYGGVAVIVMSALVGILWNRFRFTAMVAKSFSANGVEFYVVGLVVHVLMLASTVLIPAGRVVTIIESIAPTVLIVYPIGNFLLSMIMLNQRLNQDTLKRLKASEIRFKTMFEQAPIGMSLTDLESGAILDVNQKYLDILMLSKEELLRSSWMLLTHPDDLEASRRISDRMKAGENGPFILDKRFIRADGNAVWVSLAITVVNTGFEGKRQSLCMTTDISQRKMSEQRILFANTHDSLTMLHNRTHFEEHVRRLSVRHSLPLTVAFGDINGLSLINDAFGRKEGDRLLRFAAQAIVSHLREGDYAARVGGDEFALLLPGLTASEADALLARIRGDIAAQKFGESVHTSITFGFDTVEKEDGDVNEAIRRAENDVSRRKMFDSPNVRGKAITAIINTLHEKNKREELHSRRVSALCERLALALGLSASQVSEMRTVGLLHDIGKIAISEAILNKQGKLSADEWSEMKRHPEIGYRILGTVNEMTSFADFVLAHHERIDGTGYPRGLSDGDIPIQSRIIAIADAYDAMTSERTYRDMFSEEEAVAELHRCAGTQFDQRLAKVFVEKVLNCAWPDDLMA